MAQGEKPWDQAMNVTSQVGRKLAGEDGSQGYIPGLVRRMRFEQGLPVLATHWNHLEGF